MTTIAPDRSHREEFSLLVLLRGDVEEGASADNALVPGEDPFLLVFLLTHFFIFAILALKNIVALELLFHTNVLPGKPPISRRAHHLILITVWRLVGLVTITATTARGCLLSAVGLIPLLQAMNHPITLVLLLDAHLPQLALISRCAHLLLPITVVRRRPVAAAVQALATNLTLARCVTGASVGPVKVAASPFPKCLVAAHDGICALPSCRCVCELGALVGDTVVIAPAPQLEAVAFATIYIPS